jgi:hypothetical protein
MANVSVQQKTLLQRSNCLYITRSLQHEFAYVALGHYGRAGVCAHT